MTEVIYQVEAYGRTLTDAVKMFCNEYWDDGPRKYRWYGLTREDWKSCTRDRFTLVDGNGAIYEVRLVPGVRFESIDTYQIWRLDSARTGKN